MSTTICENSLQFGTAEEACCRAEAAIQSAKSRPQYVWPSEPSLSEAVGQTLLHSALLEEQ